MSVAHDEVLSPDQCRRYHEDGFLGIDELVDKEGTDELRQAYDDILAGTVPAEGDRLLGGVTRQVMLPSEAHPVFHDNVALRHAFAMAQRLLETEDVTRAFDMLIYKPPGHPAPTPWHQDFAYSQVPTAPAGVPIPLKSIQFWVALDDADVENGCMHFVPGCHRRPLLEHKVASGDPDDLGRLLELTDPQAQLDLDAAVAVELRAGGCTLHSSGTPHFTPPNRSADRPRRAYIVTVTAAGQTPPTPYVRDRGDRV